MVTIEGSGGEGVVKERTREERERGQEEERWEKRQESPVDLLRRSLLNGLCNFGEERGE